MNESHLKLEFYPLHSAASSCNLKCALGYRDVGMSLIIHESLSEAQQAKLHTILDFSTLIGHPVFPASCLQVKRLTADASRLTFKSNFGSLSVIQVQLWSLQSLNNSKIVM